MDGLVIGIGNFIVGKLPPIAPIAESYIITEIDDFDIISEQDELIITQ